jgi:hypothetical protein
LGEDLAVAHVTGLAKKTDKAVNRMDWYGQVLDDE